MMLKELHIDSYKTHENFSILDGKV